MMKKIWTAITLVCVISLSLVLSEPVLAQSAQNNSLVQAVKITPEKAEEIALTRVGGGTVMDIELKREYQQIIYEVEIIHSGRKYEIKIDTTKGKIVKFKDENLKRSSVQPQTQNASLIQDAQITFAKAEGIALEQVGGTVMDIELKREYQQIIYEIEIIRNGQKSEIKIDAATGKIIKLKSKSK